MSSFAVLEILQLLIQLLINSLHLCALLLRWPSEAVDLVIHDTCWVCSAFLAYSSAEVVSESISVCRHLFLLKFINFVIQKFAFLSFYTTVLFLFTLRVGQILLPGWISCQQQMLIACINVLQATNRGDMVTDTFGHKCVFSEIIQFYLFIYWKSTLYTCLPMGEKEKHSHARPQFMCWGVVGHGIKQEFIKSGCWYTAVCVLRTS